MEISGFSPTLIILAVLIAIFIIVAVLIVTTLAALVKTARSDKDNFLPGG